MTNPHSAEQSGRDQLSTVLSQYQKLCRYCDDTFTAIQKKFHPYMQCSKGCASCCILETVVPLEAHVIASHQPASTFHRRPEEQEFHEEKPCIFLDHHECTIYDIRPIICRTHGLPLQYPDREGIDICPLNFVSFDLTTLDSPWIIDAANIAENLMRLNLAFCMLIQRPEIAAERIPLTCLSGQENPLDRV
ncbi:hypothetical protein CSA56_07695 [candidate division KSB3 bacterium]|uniref:Zinc/iron-chelating domain-containing protein n=1 Tax=candidate division KSB3 bacterium TaxID=2044937 RepID=A0A2G6KFG0_9BACT|nr:MAG: hypothetical protein CSA56_07695 [candidate division KSB3 bacterium]